MTKNSQSIGQDGDRLDSWKKIAAYLGKDVRTALRWSKDEGMPVYRHAGGKSGAIYAYRSEIDEWIRSDRSAPLRLYRKPVWLWAGAATVLALALVYFAFDRFVQVPARVAEIVEETAQQARSVALVESYDERSIAVLPFVNMSSDPEQEYFSDGLSEELSSLLAQVPELRVISRASSFTFKNKDIDIPTIAKQLSVAYVLEGSVRKAGNQVRITAQLIEARSDTHLWSETYDRELVNIFVIQDEISAAIIGALKEPLGLEFEAVSLETAAVNIEAHDAYLRSRHLIVQRTRATVKGAVKELEKAIALDPDYALAHAELAMATLLSGIYADLTDTEAIAKAAPHVERSLALDTNLAQAHAAKGYLFMLQNEYEEALTHYERAIQINPNYSRVHTWMAFLLFTVGRYEEAMPMYESALRLDPV